MRKTLFVLVTAGIAAGSAQAQSYSSFQSAASTGLDVTFVSEDTYTVSLGASPTLTFQNVTYNITDVFGFWALSTGGSNFADTSDFGVWDAQENLASGGSISGWKTNPNSGIEPSGSQVFKFDSLTESAVSNWGFHIRVDGQLPSGGNTAYFTVPAPGALALAGVGGFLAVRRRR